MRFDGALRRVDPQGYQRAQWVRAWLRVGRSAGLHPVDGADRLIALPGGEGGHTWQVLLRPRDWLDGVFPLLEGLLPRACADEQVLALFCAANEPLLGEPSMLPCPRPDLARLVRRGAVAQAPLPRLDTPLGPIWLWQHGAPPRPPGNHPGWPDAWPVRLAFLLGTSVLPSTDLAGLAVGDLLVIERQRPWLMTAGLCVGRFSITDSDLEIDMTQDEQTLAQPSTEQPGDAATRLAELPMELRFVLQESVLTLAELAALEQGQVLPLREGCERAIRVIANGRLVAEGELVRWEDGLGVELHTLHRGVA